MYLAKKKVLPGLFSLNFHVVSWYFLTKEIVRNILFSSKNSIQCKSFVNEIPTSF